MSESEQGAIYISDPCKAQFCGNYYAQSTVEQKAAAEKCCSVKDTIALTDCCGRSYGDVTASYLGFDAHSNAACTTGISGKNQCAQFAKNLYSHQIKHSFEIAWGDASNALDATSSNISKGVSTIDYKTFDPVFVFDNKNVGWNGTAEAIHETDIIVYWDCYSGHIMVARDGITKTATGMDIPVIEENALPSPCPAAGVEYKRIKSAVWNNSKNRYEMGSSTDNTYCPKKGENFPKPSFYIGFIRHNLAGIYGDVGWHDDGTSLAFRNAYLFIYNRDDGKIGWGFDNGGTLFVHWLRGHWVQDLKFTNPAKHYGSDGLSMLIHNSVSKLVFHTHGLILAALKCTPSTDGGPLGGLEAFGAPTSHMVEAGPNGWLKIDGNCAVNPLGTLSVKAVQSFEKGCVWVDGSETVHVYLKPEYPYSRDVTDVISDCSIKIKKATAIASSGTTNIATVDTLPSSLPDASVYISPAVRECETEGLYYSCMQYPNMGICYDSMKKCTDGKFGPCINGQGPKTEICGNGIDEDCNGADFPCPAQVPQQVPEPQIDTVPIPEPVPEPSPDAGVEIIDALLDQAQKDTLEEVFIAPVPEPPQIIPEPAIIVEPSLPEPQLVVVPEPQPVVVESFDAGVDVSVSYVVDAGYMPVDAHVMHDTVILQVDTAVQVITVAPPETQPPPKSVYAVSALEDATSITLVVDPSKINLAPNSTCIVGNLPGINWNGKQLVPDADGLARLTIQKSAMVFGTPYVGCNGNGLPYRFSFLNCTTGKWFENSLGEMEPFYWWGVDDQCTCTAGFALALSSEGNLIQGNVYRKNCL